VGCTFSKQIVIPILIAAATAAVDGHAQNLVPDGTFDSGIAGWHLVGRGTLAHATGEGSPTPGSLEVVGGLAGNRTQAIAGYCIASLPLSQDLQFSVRVSPVAGTPAYCRIALFESQYSDCRWIALGGERLRYSFYIGWTQLPSAHLVTGATTRSVEVRLHCATAEGATGPLKVLFDSVSVVTTSGLIFADDFESGSTARWSNAVP
jgi:hypothetical protein